MENIVELLDYLHQDLTVLLDITDKEENLAQLLTSVQLDITVQQELTLQYHVLQELIML